MAWSTSVVFFTLVVALFAVREGLRLALLGELDQRLQEDVLEVRLTVQRYYPDLALIREEMDRKAIGHAHQSLFVQLLDASGHVELTSTKAPQIDELPASRFKSGPITWGNFRLAEAPLDDPRWPAIGVRVGSSLELIQADLAKLTRTIVIVGLTLLPLAPLGGYWLAGRAIQPLTLIIRTAARLRPRNLDERLPIRHTGDELDQLSVTINSLLDRIAAYLQRNHEFIADAAHELRSPLAAIQSAVEVTLNTDRSTDEYKELLYDIVGQCRGLTVLVNQLLLLAESDTQKTLGGDCVRLDHILEKSVDMFRAAAEERGIRLVCSHLSPTTVLGSGSGLWQVINNLLDNGIKFTEPGGEVNVQLRTDAVQDVVVLRVSDTGCGIPPEDTSRIFERFYQGDKSRQRQNQSRGSGLGLSICEAIVLAHGGTISVQSRPGHGSTFTVTFPIYRGPHPEASESDMLSHVHPL